MCSPSEALAGVEVNEPLLVDSSVYIDLLRSGQDVASRLQDRIADGSALTCGVIRFEVLRGIIDRRIRDWVEHLLDEMTDCPLDAVLVTAAAHLAWRLDRRGIVLPIPDLRIASCSLRAGGAVVTTDPHFRLVPGLKVLSGCAAW
jgi:predicted nucleic acid-binding protein